MSEPGWVQLTPPVPDASDCSASKPSAIRPDAATAVPSPPDTLTVDTVPSAGTDAPVVVFLPALAGADGLPDGEAVPDGDAVPDGEAVPLFVLPLAAGAARTGRNVASPAGVAAAAAAGAESPADARGGTATIVIWPGAPDASGG